MVKTWAFSIKDYLKLSDTDIAKQTHIASTYLEGTAKIWYITKYGDAELPSLKDFLKAFKEHFLDGDSAINAAHHIENDTQGKRVMTVWREFVGFLLAEDFGEFMVFWGDSLEIGVFCGRAHEDFSEGQEAELDSGLA